VSPSLVVDLTPYLASSRETLTGPAATAYLRRALAEIPSLAHPAITDQIEAAVSVRVCCRSLAEYACLGESRHRREMYDTARLHLLRDVPCPLPRCGSSGYDCRSGAGRLSTLLPMIGPDDVVYRPWIHAARRSLINRLADEYRGLSPEVVRRPLSPRQTILLVSR